MFGNRTWISRSEIAEIHEAIANKIAHQIAESVDVIPVRDNDPDWKHYLDHKRAASEIREIDKVGRGIPR